MRESNNNNNSVIQGQHEGGSSAAALQAGRPEPDALINSIAIIRAFTAKVVAGVGFLALTWSTVVLLGGFVSALPIKEFWFLTFISMILASTVLSVYDYVNETYAARVNPTFGMITGGYFTFLSKFEANLSAGCAVRCWRLCVMLLVLLIAMALLIGLLLIDAVFIVSLVGPMATMAISLTRLIQHDYDGSDASSKGKLRAALFIFYSLALLHSLCFYFWLLLHFSLEMLPIPASIEEYGHGDGGYYQMLLRQYLQETKTKCANDPKLPGDWNLVTYAVGLLDSASPDDHLDGLRMLDVLAINKQRSVRLELLSSRHSVQNLIEMLEWDGPDQEMRERAARIVADVAAALRVAQMPAGALHCISSLLEASPRSDTLKKPKGAPITSPAFLETEYDSEWVDILSILLRLVMRLISAPGEAGTVLCHEISASNDAVHNLLGILDGQIKFSLQLQENAMDVLSEISIGLSAAMTENLVKKLYHIFLANSGDEETVSEARESNNSEMHNDEESKPPKPAGLKKSLVEKNDELSEERKHLAALLSLLVVICDNLVDADLFSNVTSVNDELAKKLKKIIEANNENTADCLRIVKLTCQVVIAIIHLKPSSLKDFNESNFNDVVSTAFKNMSDIENCMLFAVKDRQITKPAKTLSSLVKETQGLLHNAQETGNNSI
ncbi:hypothetical protein OsI_19108 [Oryza sativa Indica Group]|uniref:Uncharacterized protein n=4 Tax=Oryza TaxID=4527 RepID=B8AZV1_ORYSI|nr:hypothetical protein OsI_19108 [Oryza sativa Indica Group]